MMPFTCNVKNRHMHTKGKQICVCQRLGSRALGTDNVYRTSAEVIKMFWNQIVGMVA